MINPEAKNYRDELAAELKAAPKDKRRELLTQAQQSSEYLQAYIAHNAPRWKKSKALREKRFIEQGPDLDFDLEDLDDLKRKLETAAEYIYGTITTYDKVGGYDPQKGHMLCGEITDRFIKYLESRAVEARKIERVYEIKNPTGHYDTSCGHVYFIIDGIDSHTLVDPTYMQWLSAEDREGRSPVMVIRFRDEDDLRRQLAEVPIDNKMAVPFYLGLDSEEARDYFKDSNYTVVSEERARLDD